MKIIRNTQDIPDGKRATPGPTFDFSDLIDSWIDARRYAAAHEDLRSYHDRRRRAFAAAFGANLEELPAEPPPLPTWLMEAFGHGDVDERRFDHLQDWHRSVHGFVLDTETKYRYLGGPWAGVLEMPPELAAIAHRHHASLEEPLGEFRRRVRAMIEELLRALYPLAADRQVTGDELREHGFVPDARAPDPDDYW